MQVDEVAQRLVRECSRDLLATWENDPDLSGAYVVTLIDPKTLEVEVRQMGRVAKYSHGQFRNALKVANDSETMGWPCAPRGLGYPIKLDGQMVGVCILFPANGAPIHSRWTGQVRDYSKKVGPLLLNKSKKKKKEAAPQLQTLAQLVPKKETEDSHGKPGKPHWERSKTRVTAPVPEELAVHLLLDLRPLF